MQLIPISRELCVGDIFVDTLFDPRRVYSVIDCQGELITLRHLGTLSDFSGMMTFPAQETISKRIFQTMEPHVLQF